jgi:hypothetical protein
MSSGDGKPAGTAMSRYPVVEQEYAVPKVVVAWLRVKVKLLMWIEETP